jgi:hypothetical protein
LLKLLLFFLLLLLFHDFFHFSDRHCTLDPDSLVENKVLILEFQSSFYAVDVLKGHETEASGLASPRVIYNLTALNFANIFGEVLKKLTFLQFERQSTHKHLPALAGLVIFLEAFSKL